jgi:hypothetical protein
MENLLEILKNTVAFLMVMRIAVVVGFVVLSIRLGYSVIQSREFKRFWHDSKRSLLRYRNLIKHD